MNRSLRWTILFAALLALAASLPACRQSTGTIPVASARGTIGQGLAPECPQAWFVKDDAGPRYQLTNLAPEFQQVGLRVRFVVKVREDAVGICMAGPIADVTWMEKE